VAANAANVADPATAESGESTEGEMVEVEKAESEEAEGMADEGTSDLAEDDAAEEEDMEMDAETAMELQEFAELNQKSTSALFFVTMIGPWGIVFILLAFFTAYRVGTGGSIWW
jgi:uncharacterized membrane protein YdbT with pleckstrin-like domain